MHQLDLYMMEARRLLDQPRSLKDRKLKLTELKCHLNRNLTKCAVYLEVIYVRNTNRSVFVYLILKVVTDYKLKNKRREKETNDLNLLVCCSHETKPHLSGELPKKSQKTDHVLVNSW